MYQAPCSHVVCRYNGQNGRVIRAEGRNADRWPEKTKNQIHRGNSNNNNNNNSNNEQG